MDKRTKIGKIIDYNKVVYQCIHCTHNFIGDADTKLGQCPGCKKYNCIVIRGNLYVTK